MLRESLDSGHFHWFFVDGAHEIIVISSSHGFQGSHSALLGAQGIYSCMVGLSFFPCSFCKTLLSHLCQITKDFKVCKALSYMLLFQLSKKLRKGMVVHSPACAYEGSAAGHQPLRMPQPPVADEAWWWFHPDFQDHLSPLPHRAETSNFVVMGSRGKAHPQMLRGGGVQGKVVWKCVLMQGHLSFILYLRFPLSPSGAPLVAQTELSD